MVTRDFARRGFEIWLLLAVLAGAPWGAGAVERVNRPLRLLGPQPASGLSYSPDGTRIAVVYPSPALQVLDTSTGSVLTNIAGLSGGITQKVAVAWSPGGSVIATRSGGDFPVDLWNPATGARVAQLPFASSSYGQPRSIAFSRDGSLLAVGEAGKIRIWQTATWSLLTELALGTANTVDVVSFSADGGRVLGATSGLVETFGLPAGTKLASIPLKQMIDADLSPDGATVLTAGVRPSWQVFTVDLWDASTGTWVRPLTSDIVTRASFSPDQSRVLLGSKWYGGLLMDLATGNELVALPAELLAPIDGKVLGEFSPAGDRVAIGYMTGGGLFALSDYVVENSLPTRIIGESDFLLTSGIYSPDGSLVATTDISGNDTVVHLWDALTGELRLSCPGNTRAAFSPDGTRLVTGAYGYGTAAATVWDTVTGSAVHAFAAPAAFRYGTEVAYSPDGSRVLVSPDLFAAGTWDKVATLTSDVGLAGDGLLFSPDGREIAGLDGWHARLFFWDASTGGLLRTITWGPQQNGFSAAYFPDGGLLLAGNESDYAAVLDVTTGAEILRLEGWGKVWCLDLSRDGSMALFGGEGRLARLWDFEMGRQVRSWGHPREVTGVALAPSGREALTVSGSKVRTWDLGKPDPLRFGKSLQCARTFDPPSCSLSGDGAWALTTASYAVPYRATLWNLESGEPARTFQPMSGSNAVSVGPVAFSPDGSRVLTSGTDRFARIWDAGTGELLQTLTGHTDAVISGAWSPDGARVVTGSADGTAKVWNSASGGEIITLGGTNDFAGSIAFSPDGSKVASSGLYGVVHMWDAATGTILKSFTMPGWGISCNVVAFSPDGAWLFAGGGSCSSGCSSSGIIWDLETGAVVRQFPTKDRMTSAAFSPDGLHIFLGCSASDGLQLWDLTPATPVLSKVYDGHGPNLKPSVSLSADGTLALAADGSGKTLLWATGLKPAGRRATPLALGEEVQGTGPSERYADYLLTLEPGQAEHLLVRMTPQSGGGTWTLLGRKGDFPTRTIYDWRGGLRPDGRHEMLIPNPGQGDFYLSVHYTEPARAGSGRFLLRASAVTRYVAEVAPTSAGNAGTTTVRIAGLGFTSGMRAELRHAGSILRSFSPSLWQSDSLTVPFNLAGLAPGVADVATVWPDGGEEVLPGAFEVLAGGAARLEANLVLPAAARAGRPTTLYLEYGNAGNQDMPAPYFVVVSLKNLQQRLDERSPWRRQPVSILGLDLAAPGTAGTLSPGTKYRIPFQVIPEGGAHEPLEWRLYVLPPDSAEAVDWASQEARLRPPDVPDAAWARVWPAFQAQAGATWGQALASLRLLADTIGETGTMVVDPKRLELALLRNVSGESLRGPQAGGLDLHAGGPGVALSFGRTFDPDIPSRFRTGPMGYGWTHTLDARVEERAGGEAIVRMGEVTQLYLPVSGGVYRSMPGDTSALRKSGDTFVLSGSDGVTRTFGESGRIAKARDGRGNGLDFAYDGSGNLVRASHTNGWALDLSYDGEGRIASATDPFGRTVTYTYADGFLTKVTEPGGRSVTYEYETDPSAASQNALKRIIGADGLGVSYTYDEIGRLATVHTDGSGTTEFSVDAGGRFAVTRPDGQVWTLTADDLGRVGITRGPEGRTGRTFYDGSDNPVSSTDAKGRTSALAWGPLNNPVSSADPSGATTVLSWTYPADGTARQTGLTDPLDQATLFELDEAHEMVGINYPDGSSESLERGPDGLIISGTNRRGGTVEYGYDAWGRLVSKKRPGGSDVHYAYDDAGRMERQGDADGDFVAQFDASGAVTAMTGPDGRVVGYGYDTVGHRISTTYPDGYQVLYEPDEVGRLWRIKDGAGTVLMTYLYDGIGRLAREERGNGTATEYAYDAFGNVAAITHQAPGGAVEAAYAYTYDEVGNVLTATSPAGVAAYAYDALDRLIRAELPRGRILQVSYDAASNRLRVDDGGTVVQYVHDSQNRTLQAGDETFVYDADGNLASRTGPDGTTTYSWDAEGQLLGVEHPALGVATYSYDMMGRRQGESLNGEGARLVFDGSAPIAEYDGSGALAARYIYGFGLAARVAADGTVSYFGFDAEGNTRLVTGPSGAVANRYDYTPWGVPLAAEEALPNAYRFLGRSGVRTSPLGHVLTPGRAYDPGLGRFLSADPLLFTDGANLYRYAGDNPLRWSDPSGLIKANASDYIFGKLLNLANASFGHMFPDVGDKTAILGNFFGFKSFWGAAGDYHKNPCPKTEYDMWTANADLAWNNLSWRLPGAIEEATKNLGTKALKAKGANVYFAAGTIFLTAMETIFDAKSDLFEDSQEAINKRGDRVPRNMYFVLHEIFGPDIPQSVLDLYNLPPQHTENILPYDPNEKAGPSGTGSAHTVQADQTLAYTVYFENVSTASAPAQEVFVEDALDADLDWSTVRLTGMGWADQSVAITGDEPVFSSRQVIPDYRPGDLRTWWLDLEAELRAGGKLKWTYRTLDPATGDLPEDPYAGFLPPDDETGRGEGWASFTVRPKASLANGTRITNQASIVFDVNAPIATNEVFNTIGPPPGSASISGIVYADADGDGRRDPGEPGYAGVTVTGTAGGQDGTVRTAADGSYTLTGLDGGTFSVGASPSDPGLPPCSFATSADPLAVTLADGQAFTGADIGFAQTPPPAVGSISPSRGHVSGGTAVTLSGDHFTGATAVRFGSVACASFTVDTDARITASSPPHAGGPAHVTVTTPCGTSFETAADLFTYSACTLACTASVEPIAGLSPLAVAFAASATPSGCTGGTSFHWDFGDGSSSSAQNPSHIYTAGGDYAWVMTAEAGDATCTRTGTVAVSPGCNFTLVPTSKNFTSKAGSKNVTVTAAGLAVCGAPPLAASEAWISAGVTKFSGNKGKVKVSVLSNPSGNPRNGQVLIGDAEFAVGQAGAPCKVLSLSPTSQTVPAAGGAGTFAVTATADCPWTTSVSNAAGSWLAVTSTPGTGPGPVAFSAAPNATGKARTGTITVSSGASKKSFAVKQEK